MFDHRLNPYFQKWLGLNQDELDAAFSALPDIDQLNPENRFCWKVLRDTHYATVCEQLDTQELIKAGFFDDTINFQDTVFSHQKVAQVGIPTRKLDTLLGKSSNSAKPKVVLLSTGAFAHAHFGHIHMMEQAKKAVEQSGKIVVGGFLSPSHQDYISYKLGSIAPLFSIEERLAALRLLTDESDWLDVALTESLYRKTSVNFTDIIESLQIYLGELYPTESIEVIYVFGSDNAKFCYAFAHLGSAICVQRDTFHEEWQTYQQLFKTNHRILFTNAIIPYSTYASSKNRTVKSETPATPKLVKKHKTLLLRDDRDYLLEKWPIGNTTQLKTTLDLFHQRLTQLLEEALSKDETFSWQVIKNPMNEQKKKLAELMRNQLVINLDECTQGSHALRVSRLFSLFDSQTKPLKLVATPGSESIEKQLAQIPAGKYQLTDDDISTGFTTTQARKLLEATEHHISEVTSLSTNDASVHEVLDLRDFLVGAPASGLVIELSDNKYRVPYLWPYVNISRRGSLPFLASFEFSKQIWQANAAFFKAVAPTMTLSEIDPYRAEIFYFFGFTAQTTIVELCLKHVQLLNL